MAQNFLKNLTKKPSKPTVKSHSRSLSNVPNYKKNINFIPKFLLKTLHRRKPSHLRTGSNSTIISLKGFVTKTDEIKVGKIKRIGKHLQRNNQSFMQFIQPVPRRVTSMMSTLFRNNKRHEQQRQSEDHEPRSMAKQDSKKTTPKKAPRSAASTSKSCKFGVDDVASLTMNGERINREKSERKINGENAEAKGGMKIKRIIKTKIRERRRGEKRFELCKKKILMGEKCRPLHGTLHYDKNGVLVPEDFT